jgi:hypothetical protein
MRTEALLLLVLLANTGVQAQRPSPDEEVRQDMLHQGIPAPPGFMTDCEYTFSRGTAEQYCFGNAGQEAAAMEFYRERLRSKGWTLVDQRRSGDSRLAKRWEVTTWLRLQCEGRVAASKLVTVSTEPPYDGRPGSQVSVSWSGDAGGYGREVPGLCQLLRIARDPKLSVAEKKAKAKVVQSSIGRESFATLLRSVPMYDADTKTVMTFDTWSRRLGQTGYDQDAPVNQDPVGATVSMFFDSSPENIRRQFHLSSR